MEITQLGRQAMDVLIAQGKVIYVGSSNFAGWHIARAQEVARAGGRIVRFGEPVGAQGVEEAAPGGCVHALGAQGQGGKRGRRSGFPLLLR